MEALFDNDFDLLKAARNFLADENRWCKGHLFENKYGNACADPREATKCCAMGAIYKFQGHANLSKWLKEYMDKDSLQTLLNRVCNEIKNTTIFYCNDFRSHQDVMDVFDEAIRKLEMENAG